jgi:hypothetical protein
MSILPTQFELKEYDGSEKSLPEVGEMVLVYSPEYESMIIAKLGTTKTWYSWKASDLRNQRKFSEALVAGQFWAYID